MCALFLLGAGEPQISEYILENWKVLSRSHDDLVEAARDPKIEGPGVVYISALEDRARVEAELGVPVRVLPAEEPGLLYLPHPYVVPGGRFNEMYGWDSHFIVLGLLRDGLVTEARQMADNHLYQVHHYGKVLNANRTYYLTRSQPPFLASTVLEVYRHTLDRDWLADAWLKLEGHYAFWTTPPHLVEGTGLSRYWDFGEGPAPEVLSGEVDAEGKTHYDKIREFFRDTEVKGYDVSLYYDRVADRLTPLFYKGDRTMRESGYDPSDRFGEFNIDVIHYLPVDLNALLYRYELDMAVIARVLGSEPDTWLARAAARREAMDRYLWSAEDGLYYDYNFRTGVVREYPFATTFFPLWVGAASPAQAAAVMGNLSVFERPGGIVTSTYASGNQWDSPFGWAPLQLAAVEGMRRYGYEADADRVAVKFLSLVLEEFRASGTIVEKYDVVSRSSRVSEGIKYGYSTNEVGFGWTNAVYTLLLDQLPAERRAGL